MLRRFIALAFVAFFSGLCCEFAAAGTTSPPGCAVSGGCTFGYASSVERSNANPTYNFVAAFGDSLTQGNQDGSGITFPAQLSSLLGGLTVYNEGIGSQKSSNIAVRMNAYAGTANQQFASGFTIPTSGSVTVTFPSGYEPAYFATSSSPTYPNGVLISTVVSSVTYQGYVQDNGSHVYTFTPTVYPGSPVSVPNGNPWLAVTGNLLSGLVVIEAGENNFTSVSQVQADIAAMVAAVKAAGGRYVVLTIPNSDVAVNWSFGPGSNWAYLLEDNTWIVSTYGANALDVRQLTYQDYNPSNACDVVDHNNGVPPMSLRAQDLSGTTGAVDGSTLNFTTSVAVPAGDFITVGSEIIYVSGGSNGAYTGTRGACSTTATTHASSTAFTGVDSLHMGQNSYSPANPNFTNGYTAWATFIANWYYANMISPYVTQGGLFGDAFGQFTTGKFFSGSVNYPGITFWNPVTGWDQTSGFYFSNTNGGQLGLAILGSPRFTADQYGWIFDNVNVLSNQGAGFGINYLAASSARAIFWPDQADTKAGMTVCAAGAGTVGINVDKSGTTTPAICFAADGSTDVLSSLGLGTFATASLPTPSAAGALAYINDGNAACSAGATPTGGGSNKCFVGWNGTAWKEFGI